MKSQVLLQTDFKDLTLFRRGKVRDVYQIHIPVFPSQHHIARVKVAMRNPETMKMLNGICQLLDHP